MDALRNVLTRLQQQGAALGHFNVAGLLPVRDGKLVIPISRKPPLSETAEAQAEAEKRAVGKILLVA